MRAPARRCSARRRRLHGPQDGRPPGLRFQQRHLPAQAVHRIHEIGALCQRPAQLDVSLPQLLPQALRLAGRGGRGQRLRLLRPLRGRQLLAQLRGRLGARLRLCSAREQQLLGSSGPAACSPAVEQCRSKRRAPGRSIRPHAGAVHDQITQSTHLAAAEVGKAVAPVRAPQLLLQRRPLVLQLAQLQRGAGQEGRQGGDSDPAPGRDKAQASLPAT